MKKEDIYLLDWQRILIGEAPLTYMVEVFFKSLIIYIALLIMLRFIGKRMSGQMSFTEMAVMVTLGAIVAPPMELPDKGVLIGIVVLLAIYCCHQFTAYLTVRSKRFEDLIIGVESIVVRDGLMDMREMRKAKLSQQQLFSILRNHGYKNLGEVKRVYLEACGLVSIYRMDDPLNGPSLLPEEERS